MAILFRDSHTDMINCHIAILFRDPHTDMINCHIYAHPCKHTDHVTEFTHMITINMHTCTHLFTKYHTHTPLDNQKRSAQIYAHVFTHTSTPTNTHQLFTHEYIVALTSHGFTVTNRPSRTRSQLSMRIFSIINQLSYMCDIHCFIR